MTKKNWIWITIIIALIHGLITFLVTPHADEVLWSRFDGNPYRSIWDQLLLILFFVLFLPYYLAAFFLPVHGAVTHFIALVGNSLVWGISGAFLISFLPFMRDTARSVKSDQDEPEKSPPTD